MFLKKDLMELLRISARTFERRRKAGWILDPLSSVGHPRWSREEVNDWLAAHCPKAALWRKRTAR